MTVFMCVTPEWFLCLIGTPAAHSLSMFACVSQYSGHALFVYCPGSMSVVVLLSDGYPDDAIAAMAAANQLKNAGVRMVTIALVPADQTAARDFLRTISSSIDDAYAGVTAAELSRIYASIAESFCLGQNRRPLAGIEGPPEPLINLGDALTLRGTRTRAPTRCPPRRR